jgi:acyl-CoA reductase-like NAD-dependent aldehyde dehydrogenase
VHLDELMREPHRLVRFSFAPAYLGGMTPFAEESQFAREAQRRWSEQKSSQRLSRVREFRRLLVDRATQLAEVVHEDTHRDAAELIGTDLLPTASAAKFLEHNASTILRPRRISGRPTWLMGCRDVVSHPPRGVVGIIGTWNYPIFLNAVPILQAVVAGNAVLWKPSEQIPRTAKLLTELFQQSGFPNHLIQTLPVDREFGPQLAEADIDFLHFTGSENVGRKLAARLGERLIPSTLELSGCDAVIVRADADVEFAAKLIWYGITLNSGQTCMGVRRVYAATERYEALVDCLRKFAMASAPMRVLLNSSASQLAKQCEEARSAGCEVICGNSSEIDANTIWPTMILNPKNLPNLRGNREAIFAPVVTVNRFATDGELPTRIAESPYRLTVSIITQDTAFAEQLAVQLPIGSVVINDVIVPTAHPGTPFGGRGSGGWGVSQGAEGLLEFTVPQVVSIRKGLFRPHANPTPGSSDVTHGLLRLTHSRTLRERFRGLRQMISGMRRSR